MHWFTEIFVALLACTTLVRSWLNQRQMVAVQAHRDRVPEPFAHQIDLIAHQRAADYTVARGQVNRWETLWDVLVVLGLTLGGGIDAIDALWRQAGWSEVWNGTAVVLSILLIVSAAGLPFSIWRTFGVETRFEFNRMTPGLFIVDLLKGLGLTLALGTPLLFAILWLMHKAGSLWWVYAWLVWAAYSITMMWAWPALFAPIFNKFTPVQDPSLREQTEALLQRCGFASKGVFVMDGSRRSVHGNAYFVGIGRNKRIVFFDTLIERLGIPEIEAVLAHELGHFRLHHVRSRLLLSLVFGLAGFALLRVLERWPDFYTALGVHAPSAHSALLLFMFVMPTFTFFFTPLGTWWSRKHEFEADEFAARFSNATLLADALVKLYRDNATTLTPDHLHSTFYDSHPPALVRIAKLRQLSR